MLNTVNQSLKSNTHHPPHALRDVYRVTHDAVRPSSSGAPDRPLQEPPGGSRRYPPCCGQDSGVSRAS